MVHLIRANRALTSTAGWDKLGRKTPHTLQGRLSRAATVGAYFEAELLEPEGLTRIEVTWPKDADLTFKQDKATGRWIISGTVYTAKTYEFIFRGTIRNADVAVSLRLPASPDPWTIWKDLPVDWAKLPYPKDDMDSVSIDADARMIGASRRGRSHAHKALPRDDDMRLYHDAATGWHIIAVADGAGSAEFSRLGSQTAVETAVTELPLLLATHDPLDTNADQNAQLFATLGQAASRAADALDDLADDTGAPLQSFSTTLLMGIAKQTTDGWFFASVSIGDGLIGLICDGCDSPIMMSPDSGTYAGQTAFLRSLAFTDPDNIKQRIHARHVPDFQAFIAMTDGVSDPMFASETAALHKQGWEDLFAQLPQEKTALLDWLNFKIKGEHDDRTIAMILPKEAPE